MVGVASAEAEVGGEEFFFSVVVGVGEFCAHVAEEGTCGEFLGFVDGVLPVDAKVGGNAGGGFGGNVATAIGYLLAVGKVGVDESSRGAER